MIERNPDENQLAIIVQESGLEAAKATILLEKFQGFFAMAADWEMKAKMIVVTDASQKAEMQMARAGRLFLKDRRIEIENARKNLKEQALREGKAIDGIANVLKALIVPIENYLERQEKFAELKAAEEEKGRQIEAARLAEEAHIAKEKAEAEARERMRLENERLKAEAEAREKQQAEEKRKAAEAARLAEKQLQAQREEAARHLENEKLQAAAVLREADRKAAEKLEAERRAAAEREKKLEWERQAAEKRLKAQVECPFCHKKFIPGEQAKE